MRERHDVVVLERQVVTLSNQIETLLEPLTPMGATHSESTMHDHEMDYSHVSAFRQNSGGSNALSQGSRTSHRQA